MHLYKKKMNAELLNKMMQQADVNGFLIFKSHLECVGFDIKFKNGD